MDEMMRCRLKPCPGYEAAQGHCALTRRGDQLRAQLQITGLFGLVEWHLLSPDGAPILAQAGPAMGEFACDRGLAWFYAVPEAMVVTCDGKACLYAGLRGEELARLSLFEKKESAGARKVSALLQEEAAEAELSPSCEEIKAEESPVCTEEATQTEDDAPCDETPDPYSMRSNMLLLFDAPTPVQETPPSDRQDTEPSCPEPETALPWTLDEEGILYHLCASPVDSPFPGMLPGASFARVPIGTEYGIDHYLVGQIPLEEAAPYYLIAVPALPDGLPQPLAPGFDHYLPTTEGSGYWVKYVTL